MVKRLLTVLSFSLAFALTGADSDKTGGKDARTMWFEAHESFREADSLQKANEPSNALVYFKKARKGFMEVLELFPNWENRPLIEYRVKSCDAAIKDLEAQLNQAAASKSPKELLLENRELQTKLVDVQALLASNQERLEEALLANEKSRREGSRDSSAAQELKLSIQEKQDADKRYNALFAKYNELLGRKENTDRVQRLIGLLEDKQKALDKLGEDGRKAAAQVEELGKRSRALQLEKNDLASRASGLEKDAMELKAKASEGDRKLSELYALVDNLKNENNALSKGGKEISALLERERQSVKALNEALAAAKSGGANSQELGKVNESLKTDLAKAEAGLEKTQAQLAPMAKDLADARDNFAKTSQVLANVEDDRRALRKQLEERQEKNLSAAKLGEAAEAELKKLRQALQDKDKDYQLLAARLKEVEAGPNAAKLLNERAAKLEAEKTTLAADAEALKKQLDAATTEGADAKKALAAQADELQKAKFDQELAAQSERKVAAELATAKTQQDKLAAAANDAANALRLELKKIAAELDTTKQALAQEQAKAKEKAPAISPERLRELERQLARETERRGEAAKQTAAAKLQAENIENERLRLVDEVKSVNQQLEMARKTSTEAMRDLETAKLKVAELDEKNRNIADLESQLKTSDNKLQDALKDGERADQLNIAMDKLKASLEEKDQQLQRLTKTLEGAEAAEIERRKLGAQDGAANAALKQAQTELADLKAAAAAAKDALAAKDKNLAELEKQRQDALAAKDKSLAELEKQLKDARTANTGADAANLKLIQAELADLKAAAVTAKDALAAKDKSLAELNKQLKDARAAAPKAGADGQGEALRKKMAELESGRRDAEDAAAWKLKEANAQIAKLSKELAARKSAEALGSAAASGTLQQQLVEARSRLTAVEKQKDEYLKTVKEQEAVISLRDTITSQPAPSDEKKQEALKQMLFDAMAAEGRNDPKAALALYERVVALDPNEINALKKVGMLSIDLRDFPKAALALEKVMKLTNDQRSGGVLGYVYIQLNEPLKALSVLAMAVKARPQDPALLKYFGVACGNLGWHQAALDNLRASYKLDPSSGETAYNIAAMTLSADPKNKKEAADWYQKAVKLGAAPDAQMEKVLK